ncbi:unnamed protein product [Ambrosiozyma monospora]|uniref:Transcription factor MBP1 n=1 Tax=Ambrosiozyma monospora TaxID=43982 RepID=A0A9W7DH63_AMBMO|nr:unnamed protein product [Ambrosiozyma monospora]
MAADHLYSAVYSGVPVYEFINPKSSVMRRKHDGWINATHILKVADFPKARRTRILEKDVQTGVHEKVQGGYGKYQGTWVPMARAVEIAKEFGVFNDLATLFDYRPTGGARSPPPAPKHHHASSASRRGGRGGAKANGRAKKTGTNAKAVATKRTASTTSETSGRKRQLKAPRTVLPQGMNPVTTLNSAVRSETDSGVGDDTISTPDELPKDINNKPDEKPPSTNGTSPSEFLSDEDLDNALRPINTVYNNRNGNIPSNIPTGMVGVPQNGQPNIAGQPEWFDPKRVYTQKLLEYFLSTEDGVNNSTPIPGFIIDTGSAFDINEPIDNDGNTTFHWACAMGDLKMCDALLSRGANYRALNNAGQVPIMRSVLYNNSYVRRTFAKLLDLLRDTLLDSDTRGRTILHHIAFSTSSHNNLPSARYYSEILVTKVAETVQPVERIINFINQQDHDGNTALHIFSYNSALKCIRVLLGYNARVDIPNNRNEYVSDYLYNNGLEQQQQASSLPSNVGQSLDSFTNLQPFNPVPETPNINKNISILNASNYLSIPHYSEAAMQVTQKSGDIMEKLGELSNAFDVELQQKDTDIRELHTILTEMDKDINKTETDVKKVLTGLFSEDDKVTAKLVKLEDFEASLTMLNNELVNADTEYHSKTAELKKLIERSQAKDLAMIVQEYETHSLKQELGSKSENEHDEETIRQLKPSEINSKNIGLVLELIKLQIIRKTTVNGLVGLYADASENTETISKYRRLVSKLSNVPLDEVDESLNDIEDCLKHDNDM